MNRSDRQVSSMIAGLLQEIATDEGEPVYSSSRHSTVNYRLIYEFLSKIFSSSCPTAVEVLGLNEVVALRGIIDRICEWAEREPVRRAANAALEMAGSAHTDGQTQRSNEEDIESHLWASAAFNPLRLSVEQTMINCAAIALPRPQSRVSSANAAMPDAAAHSIAKACRLRRELKRPLTTTDDLIYDDGYEKPPEPTRVRLDEPPHVDAAPPPAEDLTELIAGESVQIEIVHVEPAAPPNDLADNVIGECRTRTACVRDVKLRDVSTQTKVSYWRLMSERRVKTALTS